MSFSAARPRLADLIGLALSSTCLIHCLALPMLLLLAPALGHWIALPEWTHAAILTLALPAAFAAMRAGWRRHGRIAPPLAAAAGSAKPIQPSCAASPSARRPSPAATDRLLTSIGALALAGAHLANWRLSHHI